MCLWLTLIWGLKVSEAPVIWGPYLRYGPLLPSRSSISQEPIKWASSYLWIPDKKRTRTIISNLAKPQSESSPVNTARLVEKRLVDIDYLISLLVWETTKSNQPTYGMSEEFLSHHGRNPILQSTLTKIPKRQLPILFYTKNVRGWAMRSNMRTMCNYSNFKHAEDILC